MQLAVLILAAGEASRMGAIKQLLKIDGETLLEKTISDAKKLKNSTVFCVLGAHASMIKKSLTQNTVDFVFNKNYEQGLSTSIVSGIQYLIDKKVPFDGLFIKLADQPAISMAYLQEMTRLFRNEKSKIIAANYGAKFGVPAIFPKAFISDLLKIKGDKGAKEFLQKNELNVVSPKIPVNLVDLDTPEDYKTYLKTR